MALFLLPQLKTILCECNEASNLCVEFQRLINSYWHIVFVCVTFVCAWLEYLKTQQRRRRRRQTAKVLNKFNTLAPYMQTFWCGFVHYCLSFFNLIAFSNNIQSFIAHYKMSIYNIDCSVLLHFKNGHGSIYACVLWLFKTSIHTTSNKYA